MLALLVLYLVIGLMVGLTGIGGILAIPGMIVLVDMAPHVAIATALASFFIQAVVSVVNFRLMGVLDRSLWLPLSLGALPSSLVGAWANAYLPANCLLFLLGLIIILAGVGALHTWKALSGMSLNTSRHKNLGIAAVGAFAGVMAGLTGAGGPVLSIPMLIALGIPPYPAVVSAMPLQIATSVAGSVGNALHGNIDWDILLPLSLAITVGVVMGNRLIRHIPARVLKTAIGLLCLAIGVVQCARAALG